MSETKDKDKKKPLGLSRPGKLELNKTIESGQVRQSFSHGRSKMVQVEVRKKRTYAQNDSGRMSEVKEEMELFSEPKEEVVAPVEKEKVALPPAPPGSKLTSEEKASRARALLDAKVADEMQILPCTKKWSDRGLGENFWGGEGVPGATHGPYEDILTDFHRICSYKTSEFQDFNISGMS